MSNKLIIIACSNLKRTRTAKAKDYYTGPVWRVWRRYAPSKLEGTSMWALSAKHGLLHFDRWVKPYDLKLNEEMIDSLADKIRRNWRRKVKSRHPGTPYGSEFEATVIGSSAYQMLAEKAGLPVVRQISTESSDGRKSGAGILLEQVKEFAISLQGEA
jgi:hypothetical protein